MKAKSTVPPGFSSQRILKKFLFRRTSLLLAVAALITSAAGISASDGATVSLSATLAATTFVAQAITHLAAPALTHGPGVGGVTASEAKVFVRTDAAANVAIRYGTDPTLAAYLVSASVAANATRDFTVIIPLTGLPPEATYYLNVLVNGVPQFTAQPYPSFTSFPAVGSRKKLQLCCPGGLWDGVQADSGCSNLCQRRRCTPRLYLYRW